MWQNSSSQDQNSSPNPTPLPSPKPEQTALLKQPEQLTPLSKPLYIEVEVNQTSPYLKELLNNSNIEFMDFTLEGPQPEDYEDDSHHPESE